MRVTLILAMALFTIIGCATIDTEFGCPDGKCRSSVVSLLIKDDKPSLTNGVIYSLPLQDLELAVEYKLIKKEGLLKQKKDLMDLEKKIESELKELKAEKSSIEEFISKLPADKEDLLKKKSDELTTTIVKIAVKDEGLAKVKQKITNKQLEIDSLPIDADEHFLFSANIKALAPYPDPKSSFAAIIQDSGSSSETIEIKTTASGLLSGGTGNSKGNIDQIFISLAGAVGAFMGAKKSDELPDSISMMARSVEVSTPIDTEKCIQKEFKKSFHLSASGEGDILREVNDYFRFNKYCFLASLVGDNVLNHQYQQTLDGNGVSYIDGLVYPRQSVFRVSICETKKINIIKPVLTCADQDGVNKKLLNVNVIAPNKLGVLKMKQGRFADNNYEYEFSDGLLTRFKSDMGNEYVSFFAMFPEMAKALVSIPAEIIQLKFDISDKEKAYYEAQTAILKEKIKYEYYLKNPDAAIAVDSEDTKDSSKDE